MPCCTAASPSPCCVSDIKSLLQLQVGYSVPLSLPHFQLPTHQLNAKRYGLSAVAPHLLEMGPLRLEEQALRQVVAEEKHLCFFWISHEK